MEENNIVERILLAEEHLLSPYAQKCSQSKGRKVPIETCPYRSEYMRDRDRILHCKSFRRLKHKTQVFLSPEGDHYRTRLTHTLEVSQIARTMARALRLNEDLVEAISLGHDLGHTPFGHAGEKVLDRLAGGFRHNEQSLRVVDLLENGKGLNLTEEVRDGILHHTMEGNPFTLCGKLVSYADRIAYINHDIEDAERAGLITNADIPLFIREALGNSKGERIHALIGDLVSSSYMMPQISLSYEMQPIMNALRDFMFERVYGDNIAKTEERKAVVLLEMLFEYFTSHIDKIPRFYLEISNGEKIRATCDYIASMSDRYAVGIFEGLFIPMSWSKL